MANDETSSGMHTLQGKLTLVTGANSGIGFQTALQLASFGAHVLLACRTQAKAASAAERIRRVAPAAIVEPLHLDLASLASIRGFAAALLASHRVLDLLVNNAGVMAIPQRRTTVDGFELQLGTNYLGHFALTGLLLPALLAAPRPRVVTVTSIAHKTGRIRFDDLQLERSYDPWTAYRQSKLADLLFALELDRRAREQHSRLLSVAAHPGLARTSIITNGPGGKQWQYRIYGLVSSIIAQSDVVGAAPTLYAATDHSIQSGEYIGPSGIFEFKGPPTRVQPSAQALDPDAARKLWTIAEQLTGVIYPSLA